MRILSYFIIIIIRLLCVYIIIIYNILYYYKYYVLYSIEFTINKSTISNNDHFHLLFIEINQD